MTDLGEQFAHALAAKDTTTLTELLADDVDFKGLTPKRIWEADSSAGVIDVLLGCWFEPQDVITEAQVVAGAPVEDTGHVSYRFALSTPDGAHTAEQQAYYRGDDRISYLRVLCSGFRPVTDG
ncbi:hypothetical protein [Marmoricola sp. OAE513]|uniref:hypothetical protein n=1 Tax=Marmoricola sp. OAE513 TaxID=2817894 RepID=UPI001AE63E14